MQLEIIRNGTTERVELPEGTSLLGGGSDDSLRIEGLPPASLELRRDGARLLLRARQTVDIDGLPFPAEVLRLVLPGELIEVANGLRVRLPGSESSPAPPSPKTRMVIRELLVGLDLPSSTAARFTCLTGLDLGRSFPIAGDSVVLGREPRAEVRIRDRAVSRRHSRVFRANGQFWVEDLGTPNGTFLNGVPVTRPTELRSGTVLEVGRTFLRFDEPVQLPPPEPPAEQAMAPQPSPPTEEAKVKTGPHRPHPEWLLIGMGAAFAVTGALVSWGLA